MYVLFASQIGTLLASARDTQFAIHPRRHNPERQRCRGAHHPRNIRCEESETYHLKSVIKYYSIVLHVFSFGHNVLLTSNVHSEHSFSFGSCSQIRMLYMVSSRENSRIRRISDFPSSSTGLPMQMQSAS